MSPRSPARYSGRVPLSVGRSCCDRSSFPLLLSCRWDTAAGQSNPGATGRRRCLGPFLSPWSVLVLNDCEAKKVALQSGLGREPAPPGAARGCLRRPRPSRRGRSPHCRCATKEGGCGRYRLGPAAPSGGGRSVRSLPRTRLALPVGSCGDSPGLAPAKPGHVPHTLDAVYPEHGLPLPAAPTAAEKRAAARNLRVVTLAKKHACTA